MEGESQRQEGGATFLSEEREIASDLRLIAEAEADFAAVRCIPHEVVGAWLKSWGAPDYKPMPKAWLK